VRDWTSPTSSPAVQFADGIALISEVHAFPSCEGLLEGIPTEDWIRRFVDRCVARAAPVATLNECDLFVVPPLLTRPPRTDHPELAANQAGRFLIPSHAIAALLVSYGDGTRSCAVAVWFQDELLAPPPDDVVAHLATVRWADVSTTRPLDP
jgi:hypothetical protein